MNPVAAVDGMSREPLATLQALVERLGPPAEGSESSRDPLHGATGLAATGPASALAEARAAIASAAPVLDAAQAEALATAQAQQGRLTLGQMAQQTHAVSAQADGGEGQGASAARRDAGTAAAQMSLAAPLLAGDGAAQAAGAPILAVPVLLAPLQMQPSRQAARHVAVTNELTRQQTGPHERDGDGDGDGDSQSGSDSGSDSGSASGSDSDSDSDDNSERDGACDVSHTTQTASSASDVTAPTATPDTPSLRRSLREHASADVQRELQAGRRVLVVLPCSGPGRGLAAARAVLLGPTGVSLFPHARWWPGDGGPASTAPWPHWRVFRDGDPLRAPVLVSQGDGTPCRVLLGTPAPRLLDGHAALLELPERLRFAQALGGQWSLLLVVAPPGWAV